MIITFTLCLFFFFSLKSYFSLGLRRTSEELVAGDKTTSTNSWGNHMEERAMQSFLPQICWRETIYRMTHENCCMTARTVRNSDSWLCPTVGTYGHSAINWTFVDFSFLLWKFRGLNGISIFKFSEIPSSVTGEGMVVKLLPTPVIPSRKRPPCWPTVNVELLYWLKATWEYSLLLKQSKLSPSFFSSLKILWV